jgi:hypothetical protein
MGEIINNNDPKRDWKKIVADSNGKLVFVPEQFLEAVKEWNNLREQLKVMIAETSQLELKTRVKLDTVSLAMREFFAQNGRKDIWTSDVGLESGALKDGQFIISIVDPIPDQRR